MTARAFWLTFSAISLLWAIVGVVIDQIPLALGCIGVVISCACFLSWLFWGKETA